MDDSPALQVSAVSYPRNTRGPRWRAAGKVRDGDIIRVNGQTGELTLLVDEAELAAANRTFLTRRVTRGNRTWLFSALREKLSGAEQGATCITFKTTNL